MSTKPTPDNNVVLVTGSSTGFERLMSTTLARRGCTVFASMRDITGGNHDHAIMQAEAMQRFGLSELMSLRTPA